MERGDVLEVAHALEQAGVDFWLDGGWGVDALLGAQHRQHDDLDLVVPVELVEAIFDALEPLGSRVMEDSLPRRAVVRDAGGRQVDLHPIRFDAAGTGWQAQAMPNGDDCE